MMAADELLNWLEGMNRRPRFRGLLERVPVRPVPPKDLTTSEQARYALATRWNWIAWQARGVLPRIGHDAQGFRFL